MIVVNANTLSSLPIGRCGENLARKVVFDIRDLESLYGPGVAELIYQRPGDAAPYPVAAVREGDTLLWTPTATDTAKESTIAVGSGHCELRWYVGDILAKSKIWRTWVEPAMDTPSETAPPEPEQGWLDQIIAVGAAAKASADAAKADADRAAALAAQVAEKAAQTAQDASDAAKAMEAAQTAQRLAEEAQSAAEAARTAAAAAQAAAETAATDAAGAKQGAETAMQAAQEAAAAAANALEAIRTLYQEMQTWAQGVIQDVNDAGSAAVQSVQSAGDTQVQRVTDEGTRQTANAKAQADSAAQSADSAAQSAQQAAESAAVYDNVVADVTRLKHDLTGLQTVVDSKADKTDLAKTNLYLDALYKLNKGQTYDVLEQESKAYSVDVPSGAKYVGIDMVGGKSVVWNQLAKYNDFPPTNPTGYNGVTWITDKNNGTITFSGTATDVVTVTAGSLDAKQGHKYIFVGCPSGGDYGKYQAYGNPTFGGADRGEGIIFAATEPKAHLIAFSVYAGYGDGIVWKPKLFDLTQMFGAGNEPSTVEEFEAMFPDDYYPYSEPTIISSQTDRVDVASADGTISQQITTNFPILKSAGSVYDYIDLNEGKLYTWTYIDGNEIKALTEPVITDITIPTELTDWLEVETGGSITFHNTDEGKRLLIPSKLSFIRKLDEVTV